MTHSLRILGRAAYLSVYEFFGLYSPRAWLISWVPNITFQLLFFALLAQFVGGATLLVFVLVGHAAYTVLRSTLTFATGSITGELRAGTVPLLVGSPTNPILVLTGRNLAWALNGLISGVLTLGVAAAMGLPLTPLAMLGAVTVLAVIEFSSYGLALLVGSITLRSPTYTNMVAVVVTFCLLAISGVNIPVGALPEAFQAIARAVPLANGLLALREVLGRADPAVFVPLIAMEVLIGVAYIGLAVLSFRVFLDRARLYGTLDYH